MIHQIVVQPRAERDIREAARFILGDSKSRAKALQWAQDVRAKIDTLQTNPERCPIMKPVDFDTLPAIVKMVT